MCEYFEKDKGSQMTTLDYYNNNAELFICDTKDVEFSDIQKEFVSYLPPCSDILDLGCGSGRDSMTFMNMGYNVTPADGSERLCEMTSEYLGIPVKHMLFQELDEQGSYDGVWACASILHLKHSELPDVIDRIIKSLKQGGVFYASFKYGDFEGDRNGRYYTDMNEAGWEALMNLNKELVTRKIWITGDVRAGRENEKWFNVIAVKNKRD